MTLLFFGLAIMVFSCISSAAGLLLLKASAEREADRPWYRRYRWMAGFGGVAVLATLLNIGAYALLPMAVIAPFAGLTIVVTLLLASTGLLVDTEEMSAQEVLAAVVILLGVGLASVCGGGGVPPSDNPDVLAASNYLSSRYADPLVILLLVFFITLPIVFCLACRGQRLDTAKPVDLFGVVHFDRALASTALSSVAAAGTGALSNTALKVTVEYVHLLVNAIAAGNADGIWAMALTPGPWLSVSLLCIMGPLQFTLLTATLGSGAVAFAVPLYQTALIIGTIVFGGLFFEELGDRPPLKMGGFLLGVATCLVGLVLMASAAGKAVAPVPEVEGVAVKRRSIVSSQPPSPERPDGKAPPSPSQPTTPQPVDDDDRGTPPALRDPRLRTGAIAAGFVPYVEVETVHGVLADGATHEHLTTTESSQLLALSAHSQRQIGQAPSVDAEFAEPSLRPRSMSSMA